MRCYSTNIYFRVTLKVDLLKGKTLPVLTYKKKILQQRYFSIFKKLKRRTFVIGTFKKLLKPAALRRKSGRL